MGDEAVEWRRQGNAKYAEGLFEEAIECYSRALQSAPDDKFLFGNRAQANSQLKRYSETIADSMRSTEIDPTFAKGYLRTGNAMLRLGQLENALEQFQKAVLHGEQSAIKSVQDVQSLMADWEAVRPLDGAVNPTLLGRARALVQAAPCNSAMLHRFAVIADVSREWDSTVVVLRDALEWGQLSENAALRFQLATAFFHTACLEDCLRQFEQIPAHHVTPEMSALQEKCSSVQKLIASGKTYMKKKQFQWSYDAFTKAMGLVKPTELLILKYLSACRAVPLMHMQKYEDAIRECSCALEGNHYEWRTKALECRGFCFEMQNEFQLAMADYEKALSIQPNPETQKRLQALRQAKPRRKDYYQLLGVPKQADANIIKAAYRTLALKYHPDRQTCETEEERAVMKARFQEISEAYMVLGDSDKRARYDAGECVDTLDTPEHDPFILFNIVCGTLPENATVKQATVHRAKQCCFWSTCCLLGTVTCPCWCPVMFCRREEKVM
eukprot:NODE_871_length_1852_cov_34.554631_g777_i0.p1 GENE.NODE_871_length_1852_cov_34.554631_g777_i0~~NODE_871_length_1852_cov_34.554631_g777_i0.p1  ORF type:complete len:498 (-),score=100.23 NODE_871_length_1852_cov_34.554631_g777_i0:223-1716(-)